jgi:hypothetical protein
MVDNGNGTVTGKHDPYPKGIGGFQKAHVYQQTNRRLKIEFEPLTMEERNY